jgi:AcrR family transcriptional regulator
MLVGEGYSALSMRKIASRLGLSQAALYRHYRDKADLVRTIIASGYSEMLARVVAEAGGESDPREALKRGIRAYIAYSTERPEFFKSVLLAPLGSDGAGTEAFATGVTRKRRSFGFLAELLERGMDAGLFAKADAELTAQALWAAMFGLTARLVIEGKSLRGAGARIAEREIEILLRGLEA